MLVNLFRNCHCKPGEWRCTDTRRDFWRLHAGEKEKEIQQAQCRLLLVATLYDSNQQIYLYGKYELRNKIDGMQNSRGGADGDGGSHAGRGGFRVGGQVGGHGSFGTLHFFLNCSRNGVEKGKSDTEQYMKCLRRLLESMGFHVVVDNFFRNCHCENGDWHCTKHRRRVWEGDEAEKKSDLEDAKEVWGKSKTGNLNVVVGGGAYDDVQELLGLPKRNRRQ